METKDCIRAVHESDKRHCGLSGTRSRPSGRQENDGSKESRDFSSKYCTTSYSTKILCGLVKGLGQSPIAMEKAPCTSGTTSGSSHADSSTAKSDSGNPAMAEIGASKKVLLCQTCRRYSNSKLLQSIWLRVGVQGVPSWCCDTTIVRAIEAGSQALCANTPIGKKCSETMATKLYTPEILRKTTNLDKKDACIASI